MNVLSTDAGLVTIVSAMIGVLDQKFSIFDRKPSLATTEFYAIPGDDPAMVDGSRSRFRAAECEQAFIDAFEENIASGREFFLSEIGEGSDHVYMIAARVNRDRGKDCFDLGFVMANMIDLLGEIGIVRKKLDGVELQHVMEEVLDKMIFDIGNARGNR